MKYLEIFSIEISSIITIKIFLLLANKRQNSLGNTADTGIFYRKKWAKLLSLIFSISFISALFYIPCRV